MKHKATPTFLQILAIASIIGFLIIIGEALLSYDLGKYSAPALLMIFGIGLMIEGQVRLWKSMVKSGLNNKELVHIITGTVGILSFVVGALSFFIVNSSLFKSTQIIISIIAVVVIIFETWLVK